MTRILLATLLASLLALVVALPAMAQYGEGETQAQQPPPGAETQQTGEEEQLPGAASPLPLVGLGGLASLAAGYWLARNRRRT